MKCRGSGLKKILDDTNNLFNDKRNHVKFYTKHGFFKVIIENSNYINDTIKISKNAKVVLEIIEMNNNFSRVNISLASGLSQATVSRCIKELTDVGIIEGKTSNKNGVWIINEIY